MNIYDITKIEQLNIIAQYLLTQYKCGVFYLSGDLGTGKTTFVQTILKNMGFNGLVQSPTYSLINQYEINGKKIIHSDLYRLSNPEELIYLDVRDWNADYIFIEWADKGGDLIPLANLVIEFKLTKKKRTIEFVIPKG